MGRNPFKSGRSRVVVAKVRALIRKDNLGKDELSNLLQHFKDPDEQQKDRASDALHSELPGESGTSSGDFKKHRKD